MPYPGRLLADDETVVLHRHPHWKALVPPLFWMVVIIAAAIVLWMEVLSKQPNDGPTRHDVWLYILLGASAVALTWLCVAPIVSWRTEHFVLTTRHVFFRKGVLRRRAHQIPLRRVQDIESDQSFLGRLLGYGSLIVDSAADQPLDFTNIPSPTHVQAMVNDLVASLHEPADADGVEELEDKAAR